MDELAAVASNLAMVVGAFEEEEVEKDEAGIDPVGGDFSVTTRTVWMHAFCLD